MEDLGQELNDDRPPNAAKDDVLDSVDNWPLRTRRMTHLDSYNYPPPVFADDEGGAGSLEDPKNDMPRNDEPAEDRSIQVPTILPSKTPKRSMSAMPRTTLPRVPRSGTSAPTAGEASGMKYDLRKPRPSNATEVIDVWPPLSAPCALHYDQHGDTSTTATTSSRGVSDDHRRMRAANSCRAIRSRRGFTLSRALRTMASTSPPGGVIGRASADGRSTSRAFRPGSAA
jgi:hypothetical protein